MPPEQRPTQSGNGVETIEQMLTSLLSDPSSSISVSRVYRARDENHGRSTEWRERMNALRRRLLLACVDEDSFEDVFVEMRAMLDEGKSEDELSSRDRMSKTARAYVVSQSKLYWRRWRERRKT